MNSVCNNLIYDLFLLKSKDTNNYITISDNDIKSITANEQKRIVTVVFDDGDVQMSKCSKEDHFDVSIGVAMCIAYHTYASKNQFHKFVESTTKYVKKEDKKVTKK